MAEGHRFLYYISTFITSNGWLTATHTHSHASHALTFYGHLSMCPEHWETGKVGAL